MKTVDAARGKWRNILQQFGIPAESLDGKHHPCPCDGLGKDRFRFSDQNGSGSYFCACSAGDKDGFGLVQCKTKFGFAEIAKEIDKLLGNEHDAKPREATYADKLRAVAKPAERSRYLESRGLEMAPGLLFAESVEYRDDDGNITHRLPAMLAPITRSGEFRTFHVTYLTKGAKANVPIVRKVLPGAPISGGGVELYPAAEEMGVAEGIETAIAAKMLFDCPTHAALNSSMLAKWEPPSLVKVLWIFADRDRNFAGEAGAYQLAHRLTLKGVTVHVVPPQDFGDWNDVLLARRSAA
jgi:putative DNA primase/helicase